VRSKLHRRIFLWFGASIVATGATVWLAISLASPSYRDWHEDVMRIQRYVGHQYALVWDDPAARARMASGMARDLDIGVVLRDPGGAALSVHGHECEDPRHAFHAPVERDGRVVGLVEMCIERSGRRGGWVLLLGITVACGTLWAFSGIIARRLARPIQHVVEVAQDIGQGKLGTRVRLGHERRLGEIAVLADAIDDMASRIEKQLRDQKELLAAVSHEIRTPLGHIRILLESAEDASRRGEPIAEKVCAELEREVLEIDDLVGELLASSRLSFDAIERRPLEGLDLAARALERAGLGLELLDSDAESIPFTGDATLLGRALANLLENAKRHAGGIARLGVEVDEEGITFVVDDRGTGFAPSELERVFDPFYRGEHRAGASAGSLGLGLSLVRRIAEAHGGRAWAENLPEGGARVGFRVGTRSTPATT
jgi:signal transduction histidine kinase